MTWEVFDPPCNPDVQAQNKSEIKLKKTTFGDGYTQTTRDGLNHIRQVLSLTWSSLSVTDAWSIISFLEDKGGDTPFYWTRPNRDYGPIKFTCEQWDDQDQENNLITVTATFRESFVLQA